MVSRTRNFSTIKNNVIKEINTSQHTLKMSNFNTLKKQIQNTTNKTITLFIINLKRP
jgi:hypothetical protein